MLLLQMIPRNLTVVLNKLPFPMTSFSLIGNKNSFMSPQTSFSLHRQSEEESPGRISSGKSPIHGPITSNAEAWMGESEKGLSRPWKGNERDGSDNEPAEQKNEDKRSIDEEPCSLSSANGNGTSCASSRGCGCGSTSCGAMSKVDIDCSCFDNEILWGDLTIVEQIGRGFCGIVYHALWHGSDVAVKVFSKQNCKAILCFGREVALIKRLRHPNILLFMGAVTSPELCIVTEFLPRGNLCDLLKENTAKLDWRRHIHMALDIAKGMNYLHHCNPTIVHRDLKSSNMLIDKNWNVKVADFDLSRVKRERYLTPETVIGARRWAAPEVLRGEPFDEKCDIYSYGVILWELITEKFPWDKLDTEQVIETVGFMNQRLDIPSDVDPQWTSIIKRCWQSDPQCRPTSKEILENLKDLQRKYDLQFHAVLGDTNQKEA